MVHRVVVSMSVDTVEALQAGGYILCALRAVRCRNQAARPVVWYATSGYSAATAVTWSDTYQAYTSMTRLQVGETLFMGFSAAIREGESLLVHVGGVGEMQSGLAGLMSIRNTTDKQWTAGLAQESSTALVPLFAAPLYGHETHTSLPTQEVLLLLTTQALAMGTVVERIPFASAAASNALLVDAAAPRTVHYTLNQGWTWEGAWAHTLPPGTPLTSVLIKSASI